MTSIDIPAWAIEQVLVVAARRGDRWTRTEALLDVQLRLMGVYGVPDHAAWPSLRELAATWHWTQAEVRALIGPRPSWLLQVGSSTPTRAAWDSVQAARRRRCGHGVVRRPMPRASAEVAAAAVVHEPTSKARTDVPPQRATKPPGSKGATGRAKPRKARPAPSPTVSTAPQDYGRVTTEAIQRWWQGYGHRWSAVRRLVERGWEPDDVLQEVLLSAVSKSRGLSRWNPDRANVNAWAGLVGRSRVFHLLQKRPAERPLIHDRREGGDGGGPSIVEEMVEPMDWGKPTRRRPVTRTRTRPSDGSA